MNDIHKLIDELALNWSMRFPNGCYDENDPNKLQYLKEALSDFGINDFILNNTKTTLLQEKFLENATDNTKIYETLSAAGIFMTNDESSKIFDFFNQIDKLALSSLKSKKTNEEKKLKIINSLKQSLESVYKSTSRLSDNETFSSLTKKTVYDFLNKVNNIENLNEISSIEWNSIIDILKLPLGSFEFITKEPVISNVFRGKRFLIHKNIDSEFKKVEVEIGFANKESKANTSDIVVSTVDGSQLMNFMKQVGLGNMTIKSMPNENSPKYISIFEKNKIKASYVQLSLKKSKNEAQLGKMGKVISSIDGVPDLNNIVLFFDKEQYKNLINKITSAFEGRDIGIAVTTNTLNNNLSDIITSTENSNIASSIKQNLLYLLNKKKEIDILDSDNRENPPDKTNIKEISNNNYILSTLTETDETVDETFVSDIADVGYKAYNITKNLFSSLFNKFNSVMSSYSKKIENNIKSAAMVSEDELVDLALELGYEINLEDEPATSDSNDLISNDNEKANITEGKLKKVTEQAILSISKNPKLIYLKLSELTNELISLVESLDNIHLYDDTERISPTSINVGDPKRFGKIPTTQVFSLIANYHVLKTSISIVKNTSQLNELVTALASEMLYGGTMLPLWKVYGYDPTSVDIPYENLGSYKLLVKNLQENNTHLDLFGIKLKYPSGGNNPWLTIYWYILFKLDKDENGNIINKHYALVRTGKNSGSSFTSNFEGTSKFELPPDVTLLSYME